MSVCVLCIDSTSEFVISQCKLLFDGDTTLDCHTLMTLTCIELVDQRSHHSNYSTSTIMAVDGPP